MYRIIIPFILGFLLGSVLFHHSAPPIVAIPIAERQVLAESFQNAAEQLENGVDVQIVHEYLRTAIASQSTSGHWANEINMMMQTAISSDPITFAQNLRRISKGLKQ